MEVHQAYPFAPDPSPRQERMLRSHAGAAWFAENLRLARCNEHYEAAHRWYSGQDLHKLGNVQKKPDFDLSDRRAGLRKVCTGQSADERAEPGLAQDMLTVVTSFTGRLYRLRPTIAKRLRAVVAAGTRAGDAT